MKTFLNAKWQNLIMVNYAIDPIVLQEYLPKGVELDYYDGQTFVSLVGFLFKDTKLFGMPIPFLGTFEEVNLRFYVIKKEGNEIKRGVVFVNETVPNKIVAWVANKLYKEHYIAVPTKHNWLEVNGQKMLEYEWKVNQVWNKVKVKADNKLQNIESGSMEEFIFEHYYGYTKVDANNSIEYKVNHPIWNVFPVKDVEVQCDFSVFYGKDFDCLNAVVPHSVFLAEGSDVSVDWKRKSF